jgi:hypothetical protein
MDLDSLLPWRGAGLALAAALAWGGAFRLLGRPGLAALAAGAGTAAGWALTMGVATASPRQLPERLPLLALAATALALPVGLLGDGRLRPLGAAAAALALLAGAWWLAGAPLAPADLRRGAVPLLGLAVLVLAAQVPLHGPWHAGAALALLGAGLWIAAPPGPWTVLAAAAAAAALGAAAVAGTAAWGAVPRLPVALALAALAAGPVLARGTPANWLAAAVPFAALWLGPALADHLRGRLALPVAWLVAGGVPLLLTWLTVRGL